MDHAPIHAPAPSGPRFTLETCRAQFESATWRRAGENWVTELHQPVYFSALNRIYAIATCRALPSDPEGGPPAASLSDPARALRFAPSALAAVYT